MSFVGLGAFYYGGGFYVQYAVYALSALSILYGKFRLDTLSSIWNFGFEIRLTHEHTRELEHASHL